MLKKAGYLFLSLLAGIVIIAGVLILVGINYPRFDVMADKTLFPGVQTEEETDALADSLLAEMTFDEKLAQMRGERYFFGYLKLITSFLVLDQFPHMYSGRNERLNIPPWVLSDGPRGAVVGKGNTSFPVAMARGASWDVNLERRVADVIGKEMRANGTNYNAAPCINLLRHPAWGRAQETYGEDPWLLGEFAVAYIQSVQKHNVMACPKHYALNSIENSRFYVDVQVDERALREVYLPHFKKAVQKGEAASIMSSYNKYDGDYTAHSKYLLTDILRDEWGFEGFVSTDWIFGLRDGIKGVKAGLDVEMPFRNHYGNELEDDIKRGEVSEDEIDVIVERILKTRFRYAFAEDPMDYDESLKASDAHVALAREVAEKSMVLLKNDGVLPFGSPAGKQVAVIGSIADQKNTGDKGSSHVRQENIVTPFEGIRQYAEAQDGDVTLYEGRDIDRTLEAAGNADQVILVVGYTHEDEGEFFTFSTDPVENPEDIAGTTSGGDRLNLNLKPVDEELIRSVSRVNSNTVVVIVAGSAVTMNNWKDEAPSILYGWYAGMEGGHALAKILYGDVNPSGKLPFTIPEDEGHLPVFDPWAQTVQYDYYHGYTLLDKEGLEPVFPFGFGKSYTTFEYSEASLSSTEYSASDTLRFSVNVKNTGGMEGEEVVQLYIGFSNSSVDRPVKILRGFDKVNIKAGEEKSVLIELPADELKWYNPEIKQWEMEYMDYEYYIGSSSHNDDLLMGEFTILRE